MKATTDKGLPYLDLREKVGDQWPDFVRFVTTGEASEAFLQRLDEDSKMQEAVDEAYQKEVQHVQRVLTLMPSAPAKPCAPAVRQSLWAGTAVAGLAVSVVLGVACWQLLGDRESMKVALDKNVAAFAKASVEREYAQRAQKTATVLKSGSDREKLEAANELPPMGPMAEPAIAALVNCVIDPTGNSKVRESCTYALSKVAQPHDIPKLLGGFASAAPETQYSMYAVIAQLRQKQPEQSLAPLLQTVRDPNAKSEVRQWTVKVLGRYEGSNDKATDALIEVMEVTGDPKAVRKEAADALGTWGEKLPARGVNALVNDLKTPDKAPPPAFAAVVNLGELARPALEQASPEEHPWVQKALISIAKHTNKD